MGSELTRYSNLLTDIKLRIRQAQTNAVFSANAELILLYWDIGRMIESRQQIEGGGAAVITRLSRDIYNDLPEMKDFSERNLKRMIRFCREYPGLVGKVPQAVAPLTDLSSRLWYMQKSEYELTRALPDSLKSVLPTIEEIDAELEGKEAGDGE